MLEFSPARILSLSCAVALSACAPDTGKPDAGKAEPAKTDAKPEAKTDAKPPEPKKLEVKAPEPKPPAARQFKKGQRGDPGMSPADLLEYNRAQGDPMQAITLEQALAGDEELADKSKGKLFAVLDTTMGKIRCELFEDQVPNTVANFVGLARGVRPYYVKKDDTWQTGNFYDGTLFHRVIPGFMLQGGDPTASGNGGPGYLIVDEFDKSLRHTGPGILSMANRGPNTGSSQFFVTVAATPHLDGKHAVFGKCDSKVAIEISKVKTRADRPLDDVKIEKVTIERAKK